MGYVALAILIVVIIWTLWRLFTYKRIPLNYYSTLNDDMDQKKVDLENSPSEIEEDKSSK
jgi:hypothetical protein